MMVGGRVLLTFSRCPIEIASMAFDNSMSKEGSKAFLFFFSQPRGQVTTTSSKNWDSPSWIPTSTLGRSSPLGRLLNEIARVFSWMVAFLSGISATLARIAAKLLVTIHSSARILDRFSVNHVSSSHLRHKPLPARHTSNSAAGSDPQCNRPTSDTCPRESLDRLRLSQAPPPSSRKSHTNSLMLGSQGHIESYT